MRKIFAILGGMVIAVSLAQVPLVFAAGTTIIPQNEDSVSKCEENIASFEADYIKDDTQNLQDVAKEYFGNNDDSVNDLIACAIKTGRFHFYLVPYIIRYLAEFGIGIAGTVSMLFIVIGGLQYMTGPVIQNKEQGKKTVTYALIGLVLTLAAWIIVNIIQVFLTS